MKLERLEILILLIISLWVLCIFHWVFPSGLFDLNSIQVDKGGDGMKNLFTFAYTVKYDQFPWFNAFLYPNGDLGLYMDNQPLLSFICIQLKHLGLYQPDQASAWLSLFNVLGFIAAIPIIYKICKYFSLPFLWAGMVTLLCISLSPQLFRITGHYGLAYAFVIPLNWYLVIKISDGFHIKRNTLFIVLFNLTLGGIHPYMLLMNVIVIGSYWISLLVFKRKFNWYLLLSMALPVLIFLSLIGLLDPINDRGQSPNGAWYYKTEIGDLLPFFGWFKSLFINVADLREHINDGYTYVGPLIFIFLIAFLLHLILKVFKREHLWLIPSYQIKLALSASIIILAFAMGIHMIITDKKIMDWLPVLANFRALGRFAWGFYYIAFILLFVWFFKITNKIDSKVLRQAVVSVVLLMYMYDAYAYCLALKEKLEKYSSENVLVSDTEISDILTAKQINFEDIQAIISLPLSTEGVEKLGFGEHYSNKVKLFPFIFQSGIPMTSTTQSRASIDQIFKSLQFANSSYGEFSLGEHIDQDKQFLVVVLKEIKDQYKDVLTQADYIGATEKLELWILNPAMFLSRHGFSDYERDIEAWCKDDCSQMIIKSFDELETSGLHSSGAFRSKTGFETIGSWDVECDSISIYELSFWQYVEALKGDVAEYYIEVRSEEGELIQKHELDTRHKNRVEVNGHWIRFYKELELDSSASKISLAVSHRDMTIDWLIIKPKDIHFYFETDSDNWMYCDHLFMLP